MNHSQQPKHIITNDVCGDKRFCIKWSRRFLHKIEMLYKSLVIKTNLKNQQASIDNKPRLQVNVKNPKNIEEDIILDKDINYVLWQDVKKKKIDKNMSQT